MTALTVSKEIIEDTLAVCRESLTADELFQNCAADGLPVSYHQCKVIAELSEKCIGNGGFYNILSRPEGQGNVLTFFNNKGELTENIIIRKPEESRERKIPKLNWLKQFFANIGYNKDRIEIKYIQRIIESHIRDGGTWSGSFNDNSIMFILKMNGSIKAHMEFRREIHD